MYFRHWTAALLMESSGGRPGLEYTHVHFRNCQLGLRRNPEKSSDVAALSPHGRGQPQPAGEENIVKWQQAYVTRGTINWIIWWLHNHANLVVVLSQALHGAWSLRSALISWGYLHQVLPTFLGSTATPQYHQHDIKYRRVVGLSVCQKKGQRF